MEAFIEIYWVFPRLLFGIVAYAFTLVFGQPLSKQLYSCNNSISNKCEWNNYFIENNQEILLDLADFALQEQP